ncbi:MAG: CPBP family intramembrane metalloprotease [Deltaproteobacteria bacterium]|nr:CPBP family intramembrane metalloprotease [Deltaproteobacteria bacterium]
MSPRLDLPIALAAWLLGFRWLVHSGSFALLVALAVAAALRLLADPVTRGLLRWPGVRALGLGAGAGLLSVLATYLLFPPLSRALPALAESAAGLYRLLGAGGLAPGLLPLVVLVVGAAEEVTWRGRSLPGAGGPALGPDEVERTLAAAALYGLAHVASGSWLLPLLAFAFGVGWGLLRLATGSLWPPLIAHLLWSGTVLLLRPLA